MHWSVKAVVDDGRHEIYAAVIKGLKHIAIHIKPTAIFSHKSAALMHANGTTGQAITGNKGYLRGVIPCQLVITHLKAQPFHARLKVH
jgi:hypothetical protein